MSDAVLLIEDDKLKKTIKQAVEDIIKKHFEKAENRIVARQEKKEE